MALRPFKWLAYPLTLAAAAALFFVIRARGETLLAPPAVGAAPRLTASTATASGPEVLLHLLLALIAIVIASRLLGALFRRIHQPPVIGEVVAGIALGPSLLGRLAPAAQHFLLPPGISPYLGMIAQLGVILFMFLVGLELDTSLLKRRTQSTIAISHASIVLPFVLGAAMSLWLYPQLSSREVPFTVFALFGGVSISVTAFPVMARILTDRGMQRSNLGVVALTCAAVDDLTAWCLLAFVVGVANSAVGGAVVTFGLTGVYLGVMALLVRPLIARAVRAQELRGEVSKDAIAVVFLGLLGSTLATEWIGIHAIFGAFALGAIIPHGSRLARALATRMEDLVVILFLPAFFAFAGMRTEIGLIDGAGQWLICGAIIAVASVGKFGGSYLAARLTGLPSREAASIGVLMNTRGLMGLVVLNVGLDLGVISPRLFTMMVMMALATTLATTPLLHLLTRGEPLPAASPAPPGE